MDKGTPTGPSDGLSDEGPGSLRHRLERAAEGLPESPGYEVVWTIPDNGPQIVVNAAGTNRLLEESRIFVREHGPAEGLSTAETLGSEGERRRAAAEAAQHRAADLESFLYELESFPVDVDVNAEAGPVQLPPALQIKGPFSGLYEDPRTWAGLWREATSGLTEARQTAETQGEAADLLLARSEMLRAAVHEWRMSALSGAEPDDAGATRANVAWPIPDPQPVPKVQGGAIVYREGSRWPPLGQWIMNQVLALAPVPESIVGRARAVCEIMESIMSGTPGGVPHPQWVRDRLLKIRDAKVADSARSGKEYEEFFGPKQLAAIESLYKEGKLGVPPRQEA